MCSNIVTAKMATHNDLVMKQRAVSEFLSAEGYSAAYIHERIQRVYGDPCFSDSSVRQWVRRFKEEDPVETNLHDRKRSDRPLCASYVLHQEHVHSLVKANRRVTQKDIALGVGISKERVQHILTAILGYRKVSARWVPRQLATALKDQRMQVCLELLNRFEQNGDAFLPRIVTGDESRVHHYDPESKIQSMEYRHKDFPTLKKFKVVASARKVLLNIFLDWDGIVHIEFLEQGQTVNSEQYVSTLQSVKARLRRVRRNKDSILHHDNAMPHKCHMTQQALTRLKLTTLPYPPYSPDLAPSDFYLFPKLKRHLKGNHYENYADVEAAVCQLCKEKSPEFFTDGLRQLVWCWQRCVDRNGDYVEN